MRDLLSDEEGNAYRWTPSLSDLLQRRFSIGRHSPPIAVPSVAEAPELSPEASCVVASVSEPGNVVVPEPTASVTLSGPSDLPALWELDDHSFFVWLCSVFGGGGSPEDLRNIRSRLARGEPRTLILAGLLSRGALGFDGATRRKLRGAAFFLRRGSARPRFLWELFNAAGRWHVAEIMSAKSDADFVSRAYRAVLARPEDASGHSHFVSVLRRGGTRLEVLFALQGSQEGRAAGRRVAGLATLARLVAFLKMPVVRQVVGFLRLPDFVISGSRRLRQIEGAINCASDERESLHRSMRDEVVGAVRGVEAARRLQEETNAQMDRRHEALRREVDELPAKWQEATGSLAEELRGLRTELATSLRLQQSFLGDLVVSHAEVRTKLFSQSLEIERLYASVATFAGKQGSAVEDLRDEVGRLQADFPGLTLRVSKVDDRLSELVPQLGRVESYSLASAQRFAVPCGENSVMVRTLAGYVLCPQDDFALVSALVEGSPYEPGSQWVITSCLMPGDLFVDVGANVGLHTLAAARAVGPQGRVLALEAHPKTAALLSRTVWMNGLAGRVTVLPYAISDTEGAMELYLGQTSGHHSLLPLQPDGYVVSPTSGWLITDARRLDDVMPAGATPVIVKIDVEGVELSVLRGGRETFERCRDVGILAEFGHTHLQRSGVDPKVWFSSFEDLGFVWKVVDEHASSLVDLSLEEVIAQGSVNIFFARKQSPLWRRLGCS